jgi:hypothetical protein
MTMEQVTEAFGEPSSTNTEELSEAVRLLQKENARIYERLESAVDLSETRGPVAQRLEQLSTRTLRTLERFVAELGEASGEQGVRSTWVYPHEERSWTGPPGLVVKKEVELLFEGNELVGWETRPAPTVPTTGTYSYQSPFPPTMTFPSKDAAHHAKGHKHHHGHGCRLPGNCSLSADRQSSAILPFLLLADQPPIFLRISVT